MLEARSVATLEVRTGVIRSGIEKNDAGVSHAGGTTSLCDFLMWSRIMSVNLLHVHVVMVIMTPSTVQLYTGRCLPHDMSGTTGGSGKTYCIAEHSRLLCLIFM